MNYNITADLVRQLRSKTGVGIMECKRALIEENGNMELALDNLRKNGLTRALKQQSNLVLQGKIFVYVHNNIGSIIEINCETDFVARSVDFINFGEKVVKSSVMDDIIDINVLKNNFDLLRIQLISVVSENIVIRRMKRVVGDFISSYVHFSRIGVLVNSTLNNTQLAQNIAMHVAASKPEYISIENIPDIIFNREKKIQLELVQKSNKPVKLIETIVNGKLNKFFSEISLLEQNFILDPKIKIKDVLKSNSAVIKSFIRFELGEDIK